VKIPARQWLRIVELYAIDKPVSSIAAEAGVSYPTVLKAFDTIQSAIASLSDHQAAGETGAAEDSPVCGMCSSANGNTSLEEIAQDRIFIKLNFRKARLVFTRKEMEYRSLWWSRKEIGFK
jgi:hypothetical protein